MLVKNVERTGMDANVELLQNKVATLKDIEIFNSKFLCEIGRHCLQNHDKIDFSSQKI